MSADSQKIVVTRGDRYDVAEWAPGEPEWFGAGNRPYHPSSAPYAFAAAAALLAVLATVALFRHEGPSLGKPLVPTVADLQAVHAGVRRGRIPCAAPRLAAGDAVETDDDGRARLRLDDGTALVIDRATKLIVARAASPRERARLRPGRARGPHHPRRGRRDGACQRRQRGHRRAAAPPPGCTRRTTSSPSARAAAPTSPSAPASRRPSGRQGTVAPERGFDDWTGGMAAPWSVSGAPRRAVGELWGRVGDAGPPLAAHHPLARGARHRDREVAKTEPTTTFFNAGSTAVTGDFRIALPRAPSSRASRSSAGGRPEGRIASPRASRPSSPPPPCSSGPAKAGCAAPSPSSPPAPP